MMPATAIPPLLKADRVTLAVEATKDGKLRVTYQGWDDAKVVLPGQRFELVCGDQGVEARILEAKKRGGRRS